MAPKMEDLTGRTFNRLTVIRFIGVTNNQYFWLCRCKCGTYCEKRGFAIKGGGIKSCGCLHRELSSKRAKHGLSRSRTYTIWLGMIRRCKGTREEERRLYRDRGITVCDKWLKFDGFLQDMGECPDNLTIERVDNNKGYHPGNCIWATQKQQNRNRRNTVYIDAYGQSLPATEWAEKTNISKSVLYHRKRRGLTVETGLFDHLPCEKLVTINGKTQNLSSWAKDLNMSLSSFARRVEKGWPPERLILPARKAGADRKKRRAA